MKVLNLLTTSALVATIAISSHQARSMDERFVSTSAGQTQNRTFTVYSEPSMSSSPLYHQAKTEDYRSTVKSLRQEAMSVNSKIHTCTSSSNEYNDTNDKIQILQDTIKLQKEILEKYGSDEKTARLKIEEEIQALTSEKQKIVNEPGSKGYKDTLVKDVEDKLEACQKYQNSLVEPMNILIARLESTRKYLGNISNDPEAKSSFESSLKRKREELQDLYKNHIIKLASDISPNHLSDDFIALLGISQDQLASVNKDRLFGLFARTLELPFAFAQTGADTDASYLEQLKVVKTHLNNRLQEDMTALQLGNSLAQKRDVIFCGNNLNASVQNMLTDPQAFKAGINKTEDFEKLKSILTRYERLSEESPEQILHKVFEQTDYGLFGLYISSLELYPITSWNNPNQVFPFVRIKGAKNPEEFSSIASETVFNMLGRHINIQVLEKIQRSLEKDSNGPSETLTTSSADFYI